MRTTNVQFVFQKCKLPGGQIYPIQFKELLTLKLRNSVSYKRSDRDARTCTQQMTEMFECFKKHEFEESKCAKEIAAFQLCSNLSLKEESAAKKLWKEGTLVPDAKVLTARQVNVLLKKYPQRYDPNRVERWPR